jgi:hypothetical protein
MKSRLRSTYDDSVSETHWSLPAIARVKESQHLDSMRYSVAKMQQPPNRQT